MSMVQNRNLFTLLTGAAVLTGASVLLLRFLKKPDANSTIDPQVIDREVIIKVLKELKKELFSVFQNFAAVAINIKQQSMGRARPEDIKMMLLEQPMFRGEIEQVEEMVYGQFRITKQQFEHYCQHIYRDDPTIKELQKQMKESFDRSFTGQSPDPKTDIPAFLTADTTFEILEKVMTESALKLNEKLLELQERGEQINFQSPKMMEIMQSLKMDSSKKDILEQYGLNKFEDPGSKILQYATQVYSQQQNSSFNLKMKQLDMKYQQIMEQLIMQGPMSNEELKQRMEQVPQQESSFPFQGVQDVQDPKIPPKQEEQKQQEEQPQQAPLEKGNEGPENQNQEAQQEQIQQVQQQQEQHVNQPQDNPAPEQQQVQEENQQSS
ncbi:unnamed protein product [Paramecium octaurelia]|uniref:Uncharacterized protein n=1 Tax=Paramecium octaurelia TaxID=43137 RepID=A0A8S1SX16_PAROT|nr:unnamed protein product [Paramecium octaurelia]